MSELFNNNPRTVLSGAINNSTTSVVVNDATLFPSTGTFRILIDAEIMKVTAVSSTTFTVVRGDGSTTAASHADKATVLGIFPTKESLAGFRADNITEDTVANRPSAGTSGRLYFPTDGNGPFAYDDGSNWNPVNFYQSKLTTPTASNFSTSVNPGSSTFTQVGDTIVYFNPAANGNNVRLKSAPSEPWTITAQFNGIYTIDTSTTLITGYGLAIRQSGAGTGVTGVIAFGYFTGAGGGTGVNAGALSAQRFNNNSTFTYSGAAMFNFGSATGTTQWIEKPSWFRITQSNTTNRTYWLSQDGQNWILAFSQTRTNTITPDQVGFFMAADATNNKDVYMVIRSYLET